MRRPRPPITHSIWSVRDRAQPKPFRAVPAEPRATVPQPAAIEKTDKRKPDKAGALAEIARRVADGEEARAVCKDIYSKYRYTTWKALERAYERANERKAPARKAPARKRK